MHSRRELIRLLTCGGFLCRSSFAQELAIRGQYLHLPVGAGRDLHTVQLLDGGELVHYFRIAFSRDRRDPLYWTSIDMGPWKGKKLTIAIDPPLPGAGLAELSEQSDTVRRRRDLYAEAFRPQFHFTAQTGWINDPNGLVYCDGEYHLFYQHDPYGTMGANKSWGHGVSRDLVHWTDFGDVLLPDRLGAIFSGSAVVDHNNTSGLQSGARAPIVVLYTSAGKNAPEKLPFTQSLAYSNDRGRTFTKYAQNPVIGHIEATNRDPKVFWHKPSGKWVMALYLDRGKFALMGSGNLRQWHKLSDVEFPDGHECPELFELPVDGDRGNTRWVMWEAAGRHRIGRFDGTSFTPESAVLPSEWGNNSYAGQTWNDAPDQRRLFISWMRAGAAEAIYPDMPFNQQMSFPRELSLRSTPDGIRLFAQPAREIARLYTKQHRSKNVELAPGTNPLSNIAGELFDIEADIELRDARTVTLGIRGTPLVYDAGAGDLTCRGKSVHGTAGNGHLHLRVLVDRTSLEIFSGGGRYVMSFCFKPGSSNRELALTAQGGSATLASLQVRELKPALPTTG